MENDRCSTFAGTKGNLTSPITSCCQHLLSLLCDLRVDYVFGRFGVVVAAIVMLCGCGGGTSGTGILGGGEIVSNGRVVDSFGTPLAGAVISSSSQETRVVADQSGYFELPSGVSGEDLVIEYNGNEVEAEVKFPDTTVSSDGGVVVVQVDNDGLADSGVSPGYGGDGDQGLSDSDVPDPDWGQGKPSDGMAIDGVRCRSNLECSKGEFCDLSNNPCGRSDIHGVCTVIAEFCPEYYSPVCGCDAVTYSNKCFASGAGVSLSGVGECR